MTSVTLVMGAGGVGKTTVAAGLAALAAQEGRRTLVLTVDPARRLAQAMGAVLDHNPRAVDPVPGLDAAMLDAPRAWRAIASSHSDPETASRLVDNPYFTAVATRFQSGQSYAVADLMFQHADSGEYDLLVVDTPPAGGGIDFLAAPREIRTVIAGRALRILTGTAIPGRRVLYSVTARPAIRLADALLGGKMLQDLADFLVDLSALYSGMAARSRELERRLAAADRVVVTTTRTGPITEARRLTGDRNALVVFNRTLPPSWGEPTADTESLRSFGAESRRQRAVRDGFVAATGARVVTLPWIASVPADPGGLADLMRSAGVEPV